MVKVVKKTTKGDITKIVLGTIKISGLLATALVAPQAIKALDKMGIINLHRRQKEVINNARNILIKSGHLKKNHNGFLSLTEKGEEKLKSYELSEYKLIIPRIWDQKWRLLIFDIPEHRKSLRDKIRNTLRSIGFKRVQDSVWIFPYDCEELVALLKADFKVGKDLLYMVVDKIENDKLFRNYYNLS